MSAVEPKSFVASPSRADVRMARAEERQRIAISQAVVRRTVSAIGGRAFALLAVLVVLVVPAMVIALIIWSLPMLQQYSLDNLLSLKWNPGQNAYGFTTFVVGSLWVTGLAMIIAIPISIFSAVYL